MISSDLTEKQIWLFEHGFYGHLWPCNNNPEYQTRVSKCLTRFNSLNKLAEATIPND